MDINDICSLITDDILINNGLIFEASWDASLADKLFQIREVRDWLSKFGINIEDLEFVGEGGNGRVYRSDDKAVKITPDSNDANTSLIASKKCNHPNLVKTHSIFTIPGSFNDRFNRERTFYIIVQDALDIKDLKGTSLGNAADMVGGYLDVSGESPPFDPIIITKDAIKYQEEDGTKINDKEKKYMLQLFRIVQSIYEHCGLKYVDVGATNIGFIDNKIVLLDLGLSDFT